MSTSPMEEMFWREWQTWRLWQDKHDPEVVDETLLMVREYSIGRYRVDFALPNLRLAIEVDGFDYHSSREQLVSDRRRQREIEAAGWRIVRFAGSEIQRAAEDCALEVLSIAMRTPPTPETIERQRRRTAQMMDDLGLTEADIDRS